MLHTDNTWIAARISDWLCVLSIELAIKYLPGGSETQIIWPQAEFRRKQKAMTTTLKDLLAQRAQLDSAISKARKEASEDALRTIHELIAEFGFTAQQVFPWRPIKKKVAQKYRDEKSGATWSGRGRAPAWIAGNNRDDFLIERPRAPQGPFLAEMAAASARKQG